MRTGKSEHPAELLRAFHSPPWSQLGQQHQKHVMGQGQQLLSEISIPFCGLWLSTWKAVTKQLGHKASCLRKEPHGPTHRAVAHAGGCCQCLLKGLALPQGARLGRACRPLTIQQVLENVTVAPQCAVDECTLALLIQVVHLGAEVG